MKIDLGKVSLMGELDSCRRGWQACEAERDQLRAELAKQRSIAAGEIDALLAAKTALESEDAASVQSIRAALNLCELERDALRAELAAAKERERVMCKPPSHCPVTGRPFFMILEGEDGEEVATYGGPFDSYTIPEWSAADAEFRSERYDHDAGYWIEGGEPYSFILVDESEQNGFIADLDAATARAEAAEKQLAAAKRELRATYEDSAMSAHSFANTTIAATARAEAAEAHAARLRRALEEVKLRVSTKQLEGAMGLIGIALAETPEQSLNRVKAEALRSTAKELESLRDHIQDYLAPDDARDDIRRVCWNRAKDLRDEADRLDKEAANGR